MTDRVSGGRVDNSSMIKLFVGLGNPGAEYEDTRHNAGFWFIDQLSQQLKVQLQPEKNYVLLAEAGLRASQQAPSLSGAQWLQLHTALQTTDALTALLRVCAEWPGEDRAALQTQLRNLLHYHCGVNSLRTRQVMMELQSL